MADERSSSWMREALCNPIPRASYLGAKLVILSGLSLLSLLLCMIPAAIIGFAFLDKTGEIGRVSMTYGLSFFSDLALILIALLAGTFARSAGTTAIYTFLLLVADGLCWLLLQIPSWFLSTDHPLYELTPTISKFLPSAALSAWSEWKEGWQWESLTGLGILIMLMGGLLFYRFKKLDICNWIQIWTSNSHGRQGLLT